MRLQSRGLPVFDQEQLFWIAEALLFFMDEGIDKFTNFAEAHYKAQELYNIATGKRTRSGGNILSKLASKRKISYASKLDQYVILGMQADIEIRKKLPRASLGQKKRRKCFPPYV